MKQWLKDANIDIKIFTQDVYADLEELADKHGINFDYVIDQFKLYFSQIQKNEYNN